MLGNNAVVLLSRRLVIEAAMPGQYIAELALRLHDLGGSDPCELDFPERCYSYCGPEGQWRLRFLVPEDMEESFRETLRSFCQEKGLPLDPSGAAVSGRLSAAA
jgi:hypothetical protein